MNTNKPNSITRALIASTVDRGLSEVEEDPKRSIRKLTDMGRLFNKGRFLDEIYAIVQDLLRNDESPYYTYMDHVLRHATHTHLKDFCISFGYSGLTFGGKTIREIQPEKNYRIPWSMTMRLDPTIHHSMTVKEVESCISQGRPLGIYVYFIRTFGSNAYLDQLSSLIHENPECAFLITLPDLLLSENQIAGLAEDTNALFLFKNGGRYTMDNAMALQKQKILYGTYAEYDNEDARSWYNGEQTAALAKYDGAINLLISSDEISTRNGQRVAKYCRTLRTHPEHPLILFDLIGDALQINRIISEDPVYFELLENGDLRNAHAILSDFRNTISLEQLLEIALPKS